MRIVSFTILVLAILACLAGAGSVSQSLRSAHDAYLSGDLDEAASRFTEASRHADDPGLIAFNRAAIHFDKREYREAELDYRRALDDAEAPLERQAKAWYNRGTALLQRGGSMDVYRSAIACFDRGLSLIDGESSLAVDARHNLELAKLRWAIERKKTVKPSKAGSSAPEDAEPSASKKPRAKDPATTSTSENGKGPGESRGSKERAASTKSPPDVPSQETPQPLSGAGQLKTLLDADRPQALSAGETNDLLQHIANRLQRDRRSLLQALTGQDRPGVKDW